MRLVLRTAPFVLAATLLVILFAGFRYNAMIVETPRVPMALCESQPSRFQIVDMKKLACVAAPDAQKWTSNNRLLNAAFPLFLIVFFSMIVLQRLSRPSKPSL
jgi:hypothetical protein